MSTFSPRVQKHLKAALDGELCAEPAAMKPMFSSSPIRASELANHEAPKRRFVVAGLIPDRNVTSLIGDGGSGKTTIALHASVCIAAGKSWLGLEATAGSVVFLSAEDEIDEVHRRLEKICSFEGVDLRTLRDLIILPFAGRDAVLATADAENGMMKPTVVWDELRATVSSVRPKMIVLDTLADVFGGNEINRAHSRSFVGMLRGLAIEFDLAVLLVSHPSQAGMTSKTGTSGSTAWSNSVRSRLYFENLKRDDGDDSDSRTLTVKKANYGPTGLAVRLRWHDGVFVLDDGAHDREQASEGASQASAAEDLFLRLLKQSNEQGQPVGPAPAKNYAPTVFAKSREANGFRKRSFVAAMDRLLEKRAIHIHVSGPPSRPRQTLHLGSGEATNE